MSVKSRLDRIERDMGEAGTVSPVFICFPKRDYPLDFDRMDHYFAALAVECPEHGQRVFREKSIVLCIRPAWQLAQDWDLNWPHHPEQYKKAMRATFKTREEYVLDFPPVGEKFVSKSNPKREEL